MESEIDVTHLTRQKQKVDQSHFELLKVLGQGSFGKVSISEFSCLNFKLSVFGHIIIWVDL